MKKILLIGMGVMMFFISTKTVKACAGDTCTWPSPTPYPTATEIPTLTPYPTETPYLTPTPLPTGAPETGPEDNLAVPIILSVGGLGVMLRKLAEKIW